MNRYLLICGIVTLAMLLATACRTNSTLDDTSPVDKGDLQHNTTIVEETTIPLDEAHFPGKLFREYISKRYDKNGDGYLSKEERDRVTTMRIESVDPVYAGYKDEWEPYQIEVATYDENGEHCQLDISGISYFTNLQTVWLNDWSLQGEEEIQKLSKLQVLICNCVDIEGLSNLQLNLLEKLEIRGICDDEVNVTQLPNLRILELSAGALGGAYDKKSKKLIGAQIDISKNKKLEKLVCAGVGLNELDLSQNKKLGELDCSENQIKRLDLTVNSQLEFIDCSENKLRTLDLRKNKKLTKVICSDNQLSQIDISKNRDLKEIYFGGNKLRKLDVSHNTKLKILYCSDNRLNKLSLKNNLDLENICCKNNQLKKLNVSKLKKLEWLDCGENQLKELTLDKNLELKNLTCHKNKITYLNLENNKKLDSLFIPNNQMKQLNLAPKITKRTTNHELYYDNAIGNSIHTLDIRSVKRFGKKGRKCIQYWITGGFKMNRKDKIKMKTVILNKNLPKQDKLLVEKMGKKFHLKIQYV